MAGRFEYSYYPRPRRKFGFGRVELLHILAAVGALTLAFTLMWVGIPTGSTSLYLLGIVLLFSFLAVITGFLMHELAHKFVALRYGLWAEFRASSTGLVIALVTALFGIVFAAPGAVMIAGPVNTKENGRISAAGPLTNLSWGGGFAAVAAGIILLGHAIDPLIIILIYQIMQVNLILGIFNMIPILPFDGSKIWRWNKPLWVAMVGVFAALLVLLFTFFQRLFLL